MFFRDVLGLAHVDAGDGWLIFALLPAELGVHPGAGDAIEVGGQQLWLTCDDLSATVYELRDKGVTFAEEPHDRGFGTAAVIRLPGHATLGIYQPKHPTAIG